MYIDMSIDVGSGDRLQLAKCFYDKVDRSSGMQQLLPRSEVEVNPHGTAAHRLAT